MLRAGTDKTRANESRSSGEGKQRRDKKEEGAMHCAENLAQPKKQGSSRQSRTKKDGGGGERERERGALIVVLLYSPVPASAMAAAGVLVAASRVLAREPAPSRHTRALIRPGIISCNKNAAQYFHVSATHTHETNGSKAQAAAQSAPLPLSLATRASQSATTSA